MDGGVDYGVEMLGGGARLQHRQNKVYVDEGGIHDSEELR